MIISRFTVGGGYKDVISGWSTLQKSLVGMAVSFVAEPVMQRAQVAQAAQSIRFILSPLHAYAKMLRLLCWKTELITSWHHVNRTADGRAFLIIMSDFSVGLSATISS